MNTKRMEKLREKKLHIGTWISGGSPVVAEIAAESGFDWLLFDMEHGFGSEESLFGQLMATKRTGAAAIVRVGAPHPDLILRVLDRGADGIMVPHVSTAEEAEQCVQAAHYPPRGRRGYSRSVRACNYGLQPPETKIPPLIVAQIETIEGVGNACAIAAVDGVDVLFVGPADLNFDLSARPGQCADDYAGCLSRVAAAAAEQGKQCGILLRNKADMEALQQLGFTLMAVDSDLGILRNQYQQILKWT